MDPAFDRATTTRTGEFAPLQSGAAVDSWPQPSCGGCPLAHLCLGGTIARSDLHMFPLIGRRRVRRGQPLFRAGDAFGFCYEVRSGTLKSSLQLSDGREQVAGFHFPGELLGMDALPALRHPTTAVALEDSEVCTLPVSLLRDPAPSLVEMRKKLWTLMALDVLRERELVTLVGTSRAEQRVAAFLINMGARMKARGYSALEFHLRMSRADIGSYLGLTVETVSRTFTAFADAGLLFVRKKHIRVLDRDGLEAEAAPAMRTWVSEASAHA